MEAFTKNKTNQSNEKTTTHVANEKLEVNDRPRICCLDIEKDVINQLNHSGFNIYPGTLGSKVKVPNAKRYDNHSVISNYDFPQNLHEFDIIIVDLCNSQLIDYKYEDHIRSNHSGKSAYSFLSAYPETIFDPRPVGSLLLNRELKQIGERPHIIVVFCSQSYQVEYEIIKSTEHGSGRQGIQEYGIYDFSDNAYLSEPKFGKEMTVCDVREDLKSLLELNLAKTVYNQTFYHPLKLENRRQIPDPDYTPLLKNSSDDIVSFCERKDNSLIFYFPQIESKGEFLNSFLTKIAPDLVPDIFPFSTTFNWKHNEEYWLPNYEKLLNEKKIIEHEYKEKIKSKDADISTNAKRYSFLHEILTESGDKLVNSLIHYLKWLGFKNVIHVDQQNNGSKVLEEDIQVELDDGLLIIECKGIGGTSTDSDCSQISKIKHRRCKERNRFDVFALYIVNHQRYLPPLNRQNPPFTDNQKQDAINDERGLLSTWQLFNLYNEIENGILDKDSVRNELLKFGYIEFKPNDLIFIDEPREIFKDGLVCIINITDVDLSIDDEILIEKNGKFQKTTIVGIQLSGKPVATANSGEIGLQLSSPIKKKSNLWKKSAPNSSNCS